eukprot:s597_g10.t1
MPSDREYVAQQRSDSVVIQNAPVVIYLIVVSLMERLYQKGVSSLVHMEGHVSYAEHLKSLISKTLFFQLVNYLGWFLYVAFCIQDLEYLRSQLLSFMTVKQVVAVAQEVLLPVILQRFRRWQGKAAQASSKEPDAQVSSAAAPKTRRCASLRRLGTHAVLGDGTSLEKDVGRQLALDKTDLCTEYQQLVVLFALTSSFAIAFPCGPLLALLHSYVSRRTDGYKFLMVNMLSAPSAADGVISDTWVEVLEALSIVSVVCNVAVLAVSGSRWTALSLAVLEHALLIFKASLRAIDALHMKELGGRYIEARCQGSKGREEMNRRKMVHMIRPTCRDALSATATTIEDPVITTPSPPRFWKQEPD